jgi:hypothetical protein
LKDKDDDDDDDDKKYIACILYICGSGLGEDRCFGILYLCANR